MLARIVGPTWRATLLLLLIVLPVYALTANYDEAELNVDAEAAALAAWSVAEHGTADLADIDADEYPQAAQAIARNPWIGSGERGTYSNRPVGLWATAVPAYLLTSGDYRAWPATVTAILMTAAAMAVALVTAREVMPPVPAWLGALGLSFLTATWPISSQQLWPHGPGQLLLALALLGLARRRAALTAAAFAGAGLIRLVTLVMAGVVGALQGRRGRWAWTVALACGGAATAGITLAYNWATFGGISLVGGYGDGFQESLVSQGVSDYLTNLAGFFVSVRHGLLLWTPVLIPAAIGARHVWREQPAWVRQGAVAALAYLVVHARLNRVSGGLPFDYRYPLEPLVLVFPLAVQGLRWAVGRSHALQMAVVATAGLSLALQGLMATTAECVTLESDDQATCSLW